MRERERELSHTVGNKEGSVHASEKCPVIEMCIISMLEGAKDNVSLCRKQSILYKDTETLLT